MRDISMSETEPFVFPHILQYIISLLLACLCLCTTEVVFSLWMGNELHPQDHSGNSSIQYAG